MPDSLDFILRFLLFAAVHSALAVPAVQQRIHAAAGRHLTGYRLAYNLLSLVLFGWVMLAWQSTSVLYVLPGVWSLACYGLQVLLLIAMGLCLKQTGLAAFLGTDLGRQTSFQLISSGCYAIVRHPLYLLGLLFFISNPVMTTRWLTLSILGTIYLLIGALLEERRLLASFGDSYREYQARVPFLIPGRPFKRQAG